MRNEEQFDEQEFDEDEFLEELAADIFTILVERGYAPGEAEVQDIAEMFLDLLIEFGLFEDEDFEEDEDE